MEQYGILRYNYNIIARKGEKMSLIKNLHNILNEAKNDYENTVPGSFKTTLHSLSASGNSMLVKGDNLSWMKYMADIGYGGRINLIYIDPPFFSKSKYDTALKIDSDKIKNIPLIKLKAYSDTWEKGAESYFRMLCARLYMMRELLADDGCIFVHLDWHISHYVKIILDEIFGEKNFVNEIIWNYKSGGTSKRHFSKKHDALLFYSKTNNYYFKPQFEKSYNREFKPYRFKGVKEYKDDIGWYTMVNMKDVWQIDMVGRTSSERTGYATQKPEALLERIVESCSKEGDICADLFGGSGTLAAVCHRMGRKWISCDSGGTAFAAAGKRLINAGADFVAMEQSDIVKDRVKCAVEAEITVISAPLSDKSILNVNLISYDTDIKKIAGDAASEKALLKVIGKDPLSLIDYWSVDFDYDGKAHKPHMIMFSGKDKKYECQKIGNSFNKVSVHVADVFGNNTFITEEVRSDKSIKE